MVIVLIVKLIQQKVDGEGASHNTKDVRDRCDGSLGDSEHIEGKHGAIASGQDGKALSEHDDVVEIDQPVNAIEMIENTHTGVTIYDHINTSYLFSHAGQKQKNSLYQT